MTNQAVKKKINMETGQISQRLKRILERGIRRRNKAVYRRTREP